MPAEWPGNCSCLLEQRIIGPRVVADPVDRRQEATVRLGRAKSTPKKDGRRWPAVSSL